MYTLCLKLHAHHYHVGNLQAKKRLNGKNFNNFPAHADSSESLIMILFGDIKIQTKLDS